MEHLGVILSLFGVMFLAIIGVYTWTFKVARDTSRQLGDIYRTVNTHIQQSAIHTDKDEFVPVGEHKLMCDVLTKVVDEIKADVKSLLMRAPTQE